MAPPSKVTKIAIVGTGTIGSGWASLFCAKGYTVVAFVRSPASKDKFLKFLESAWSKIVKRGFSTDPEGYKKVQIVMNLAECVADADYVQESVLEDLHLKQSILQECDEFAPPDVIIGSSTSFIPLSLLQMRAKKQPGRIAIAHPSVPQFDAFCEVLGSSEDITQWLGSLHGEGDSGIEGLGMDIVLLKRECHGHAFNSLILMMYFTCYYLRRTGVCDAKGVDTALVHVARCIIAGGGFSGCNVGLIGGNSIKACGDLNTDIVMGIPLGMSAVGIRYLVPWFLRFPALWLLQVCCWPIKFFKSPARRFTDWMNKPWYQIFDESPAAVVKFEAKAMDRICAMEKTGSCTETPETEAEDAGGS